MKKFLLATVSMVALASATRAADMPAAMPAKAPMYMPAPIADWSGAYLGIQGGVVRRDATLSPFDIPLAGDKIGGIVGALLGYNWQRGNFVYGLEGDWNWIGAKASDRSNLNTNSSSYDVNWLATLRGRAGLALDSTLFYVTGGVAFGHVENSFTLFDGTSVQGSFTQKETKAGCAVGAGVEHMLAPQWTARGEFRYVDLGKSGTACAPGIASCDSFESRPTSSNTLTMGLVGLNYKFGGSRAADWSHRILNSGQVASFTQNQTKVGWTAGVGVEHMFSRHWTARAEFRYVDLGKTNVASSSATDFNDCVSLAYRGDFSNTLKLGLVGLAYKF